MFRRVKKDDGAFLPDFGIYVVSLTRKSVAVCKRYLLMSAKLIISISSSFKSSLLVTYVNFVKKQLRKFNLFSTRHLHICENNLLLGFYNIWRRLSPWFLFYIPGRASFVNKSAFSVQRALLTWGSVSSVSCIRASSKIAYKQFQMHLLKTVRVDVYKY